MSKSNYHRMTFFNEEWNVQETDYQDSWVDQRPKEKDKGNTVED